MPEATSTIDTQPVTAYQEDAFELLLKPENQEALRVIVEQLPKLASVLRLFGKLYDAAEEILSDGATLGAVEELVKEKTSPVMAKYRALTDAYREAKVRAEHDRTQFSVFGVLRLLKDPVVQENLRLISAFLAVQSERKAAESTGR
ncbi:MAG: DUF1641 domain-containing protein [Alicyclobacillus mali]|uniref:DUF1641 domain-containing protein n=1 Tax=Alicyclobacillus mali (ex Roth et al. 2021) TaxID=1123961 RepID=UPI0023F496B7|nr:DUF1641 domain-containing protein [Alicyclobacillus mali (ex Roth et al. 2021)]MCL6487375.1 DUF1641 domain-containing protein [Alicyclobacillus mali (ex Roth et al. 2021)]